MFDPCPFDYGTCKYNTALRSSTQKTSWRSGPFDVLSMDSLRDSIQLIAKLREINK